jgi:hypothetical protein
MSGETLTLLAQGVHAVSLPSLVMIAVALALLYLGLFAWSLLVDGHIYRHALSIKLGGGVLTAVLIFAVNFALLRAVFA